MNNVEKAKDSYKSRMALKWGIPVVSVDFIHKCVEEEKLLETDPFVVVGKTAAKEFGTGKIIGELTESRDCMLICLFMLFIHVVYTCCLYIIFYCFQHQCRTKLTPTKRKESQSLQSI